MQAFVAFVEPTHAAFPRSHGGPILDSCDSGEEFSLYHWVEVCKLVDEEDMPPANQGFPSPAELEEDLERTWSEVKTATAYKNFPGDVV